MEHVEKYREIVLKVLREHTEIPPAYSDTKEDVMFKRTIRFVYSHLTLNLILIVGLMMFSHTGDTAEPEVWFSFTGNKAKVAEDASGNGNDGRIVGGAKRVRSKKGPYGMGIELSDSVKQYIEFDYLMTDPGTVLFWFKPYWNGDEAGTFRVFDANNADVFLSIGKGATIREREYEFHFAVEDVRESDYYLAAQAAEVVKKDTWMHIAATWDFGGDAFFYINGEEIDTRNEFAGFPEFHESPRIGGNNIFKYRPTTSGAHGVIDEFAIYSEALSQEDIQRDMEFLVSDVKPEEKIAVTWGRIKSE